MNSTGQYYYNSRWYDPNLGRFTTEDPIRSGLNWYAYANNNPLRFVDPTGLFSTAQLDYRDYGLAETDYSVKESPDYYKGNLEPLSSEISNTFESIGDSIVESANEWNLPASIGPNYYATPYQFEKLGATPERAAELAQIQNDSTVKGTLAGAGLIAGGIAGTLPLMGVGAAAAVFSDQTSGGTAASSIEAAVISTHLSWIPIGQAKTSIFTEGLKSAAISAYTQKMNGQSIDRDNVIKTGIFGAANRGAQMLGVWSGLSKMDQAFYDYIAPTAGAAVISTPADE